MVSVCIIIYLSCGLVHGIPTNYIEPLILSPENGNLISINPSSSHVVPESEVKCIEDRDNEDIAVPYFHDVVKLPNSDIINVEFDTPALTSYIRAGVEGILAMDYDYNQQDTLPVWADQYPQSVQESNQVYEDQEPVKITMDIGMNNYDDDENELPNPVLPLDSIPKIYSTYAQQTVPVLEAGGNELDALNPENTEVLFPNIRPNRSKNVDYEKIIAELQHNAMLNNIVPTMSYVRGAEDYVAHPVLQTAIYPIKTSNGCGLPLLLGCNPKISRGILTNLSTEQTVPVASIN